MNSTNLATYTQLTANLPLSSYPLNALDRLVLAAIADEPFEALFDAYGYPRNDVAARIAAAIGRDESDVPETYQSLKILKMLLTDALRKQGVAQ
jgi:hypothetical protein